VAKSHNPCQKEIWSLERTRKLELTKGGRGSVPLRGIPFDGRKAKFEHNLLSGNEWSGETNPRKESQPNARNVPHLGIIEHTNILPDGEKGRGKTRRNFFRRLFLEREPG